MASCAKRLLDGFASGEWEGIPGKGLSRGMYCPASLPVVWLALCTQLSGLNFVLCTVFSISKDYLDIRT